MSEDHRRQRRAKGHKARKGRRFGDWSVWRGVDPRWNDDMNFLVWSSARLPLLGLHFSRGGGVVIDERKSAETYIFLRISKGFSLEAD